MNSGIFPIARIAVIATIAGHWFPYDRNDRHWVATIAEIELKSILAKVVATIAVIATIAEEWFPYGRNER